MLALSITHSHANAEDAVHDAFARLCGKCEGLPEDPLAYVFAAARNAAIDRLRMHSPQASAALALTPCLDADDHAVTNERDLAIARMIDALPEELRAVVLFRVFAGLTFRHIGELTGSPTQTVVSCYASALEQLRPQLRNFL